MRIGRKIIVSYAATVMLLIALLVGTVFTLRTLSGISHTFVSERIPALASIHTLSQGVTDVSRAVHDGDCERGIMVCGSGAGVAVAACKLPGIRAAVGHDTYTAAQCVQHDDCNVLALGSRVVGPMLAAACVRAFVSASFSGEERHVRRLGKITAIEREGFGH